MHIEKVYHILTSLTDINECTANHNICGLGICINNDDGMFYECYCQDGTMSTGINSAGTLTCIGRYSVATPCNGPFSRNTCISFT